MPDQPEKPGRPGKPDRSEESCPVPDAGSGAPPQVTRGVWATLMRPSRAQVVVGVLLALLGFVAVTGLRANEADDEYAGYREEELINVLNQLTTAQQQAEEELTELRRTREELVSDTNARQAAIEQARSRARQLAILAGTVPVAGPGVTITIHSDGGEVSLQSMLDLVQELRTAGAEAIEINGRVRLVAQSAFGRARHGIEVDGTTLTPPYRIDVIGEPTALIGALTFPRGPIEALEGAGAQVEVAEKDRVVIRSQRVLQSPEYASPPSGQ